MSNLHLDTEAIWILSLLLVKTKEKGQISCKNPIIYFNTASYFETSHWKIFYTV